MRAFVRLPSVADIMTTNESRLGILNNYFSIEWINITLFDIYIADFNTSMHLHDIVADCIEDAFDTIYYAFTDGYNPVVERHMSECVEALTELYGYFSRMLTGSVPNINTLIVNTSMSPKLISRNSSGTYDAVVYPVLN